MTRRRSAVTARIDDPVILLHRGSEVVFDENFADHLDGLPAQQRRKWLEERCALLLDEYNDGAFDTNGELDPWEPD